MKYFKKLKKQNNNFYTIYLFLKMPLPKYLTLSKKSVVNMLATEGQCHGCLV